MAHPAAFRLFAIVALLLLVAACGTTTSDQQPDAEPEPTAETLLDGLWLLTPSPEGADPVTVEFGTAMAGHAQRLVHDPDSGVTRCEDVSYALLADGSVRWGTITLEVRSASAEAVELVYPDPDVDYEVTFSRVAGERPAEPCATATTEFEGSPSAYLYQDAMLTSHDGTLYFSTDAYATTHVAYDLVDARGTRLDAPFTSYNYVLSEAGPDVRYYYVNAGASDTLVRYVPSTDTSVDQKLTTTDTNYAVRIEGMVYDERRDELLIAGNEYDLDAGQKHRDLLLTLDGTDFTVLEQREFLPDVSVQDLAFTASGDLLALTSRAIVEVGTDGTATATITPQDVDGWLQGLASSGTTLYLLSNDANRPTLSKVTLP